MLKADIFNAFQKKEIDVFQAIKLLETNIDNKKNEGVVYTPKYIADHIVKNIHYQLNETVFEPSAGHGIFIFSLLEHVEEHFHLTHEQLRKWFEDKVFTNELSYEKMTDFQHLLSIYFSHKNEYAIKFNKITFGDTLKKSYPCKFDVLIGNPPYIRTKNLNSDYLQWLRQSFHSCKQGNVDIFYAFMEMSLNIAHRSSMIVPNSFINNKSAFNLRQIIKPYINTITDFKAALIFDPVRTYTCIYQFSDKQTESMSYSNHLNGDLVTFLKEQLSDQHWIFDVRTHKKLLPDNIVTRSGTATLKDKAYIIENPETQIIEGIEYINHTYHGVKYLIEKAATLDFYKITKMNKSYRIINPYDENFNIIKETDMQKKYPYLYAFFNEIKADLNSRDKGKTEKYESWYAYGRKQGLFKNNQRYHVLIPLMTNLPIKAFLIEEEQNFLFSSGYVMSSSTKEEALSIKSMIESAKFAEIIKKIGKEWPGKEKYYTYSITQLRDI